MRAHLVRPPVSSDFLSRRERSASPARIAAVRSEMAASFGHDFSAVRVHQDSARAAAAGTPALTIGNEIHFAHSFDRAIFGHELAHVVQQRQGRVHADRPGVSTSPALEAEAQPAGGRAARGEPALLDARNAFAASASVAQHYTEVLGLPYDRLSDDGKLAVLDHGKIGWAESTNIASSNAVLATQHSKAKIEELAAGGITVAPPGNPGGPTTALKKFRMRDRVAGTELDLTDDCGTANQQLMGSGTYGSESYVARNLRGTTEEFTAPSTYRGDDRAPGGVTSTTEDLSGEIYIRIFEREYKKTYTRVRALEEWEKLGASEKKTLSKKYGINQFAVPKVGQGITIGTERDMPPNPTSGYNFHFALNLLASGHDYITLEDYDSSGVPYYLDMYGPANKTQSFAQDPGNTGAMGDVTTTMVVQHAESLNGKTNADVKIVGDPAKGDNPRAVAKGDGVTIVRKGINWMKVKVLTGAQAGQQGWMLNTFFEPQ